MRSCGEGRADEGDGRQEGLGMSYEYSRWWRGLTVAVVPSAMRLLVTERWQGRQHVPRDGGLIVAANHVSEADPLAICAYIHWCGRYPIFLAKASLFGKGPVGTVVRGTGQIPVLRGGTSAADSLAVAEEALAAGQCLIVYPEGTCTRDPNLWPMTGQTGAARLALGTGTPVIPMASWGSHELLPYRKGEKGGLAGALKPGFHPLPRKTVQILAGPPVDLGKYRGQPLVASALHAATADIMGAVTRLVGELRGEQPPAEPYDRHGAVAGDAG
jgi:1-acyl-sn-glycerol-3-phosphate acyltransferase